MKIFQKPKRWFWGTIAIDAVILLAYLLYLAPHLRNDPDARTALIAAVAAMIFAGGVIAFFFRPLMKEQAIIENGVPAQGKVLSFRDTGTTINDDPLVELTVEVLPQFGAAYQATTRTLVSRLQIGQLRQGAKASVMVHKDNPQQVAFIEFTDPPQPDGTPSQEALLQARLDELSDLRLRGYLSEGEYEKRRKELENGE